MTDVRETSPICRPTTSATEPAAISVRDLRVRYGEVDVVDGLSFDVAHGEVVALLGPNGAGKTTTVEVLEGHRRRSGGDVSVLGFDPHDGGRALRERIGIVLQEAGLDGDLTVWDALRFFADLYPNPRDVEETIDLIDLESKSRARVRTLSGGQRRRLDLALALIGRPELLFLDEPTTGLDPAARRQAWSLLDSVRLAGTTIMLTSHYMEEVERLADRVVVMKAGRAIATESPATIGGRHRAIARIRFQLPSRRSVEEVPTEIAALCEVDGLDVRIRTVEPTRVLAVLATWALDRGEELIALTVERPTLEDVLLDLTATSEPST